MPTYDFRCTACGHTVEHFFRSVNCSPVVDQKCPLCGAPMVKLVGQTLGFTFKNRAGMTVIPGANKMDLNKGDKKHHDNKG